MEMIIWIFITVILCILPKRVVEKLGIIYYVTIGLFIIVIGVFGIYDAINNDEYLYLIVSIAIALFYVLMSLLERGLNKIEKRLQEDMLLPKEERRKKEIRNGLIVIFLCLLFLIPYVLMYM